MNMITTDNIPASIAAPSHITSLQSAGILVGVRVRTTTGTVKDNEASAEIAAQPLGYPGRLCRSSP